MQTWILPYKMISDEIKICKVEKTLLGWAVSRYDGENVDQCMWHEGPNCSIDGLMVKWHIERGLSHKAVSIDPHQDSRDDFIKMWAQQIDENPNSNLAHVFLSTVPWSLDDEEKALMAEIENQEEI